MVRPQKAASISTGELLFIHKWQLEHRRRKHWVKPASVAVFSVNQGPAGNALATSYLVFKVLIADSPVLSYADVTPKRGAKKHAPLSAAAAEDLRAMDSVDLGSMPELDDFEPGLAFDSLLDGPVPDANVRVAVMQLSKVLFSSRHASMLELDELLSCVSLLGSLQETVRTNNACLEVCLLHWPLIGALLFRNSLIWALC